MHYTFLKKQNLPSKALLNLDNAPGHASEEQLKSRHGLIGVMFLPPSCTPLLQPLDQNVIQFVKSHYKKKRLLCSVINQNYIIQCVKRINLRDLVLVNKAIMGPSIQQFFFSSSDVIATTCFDHTTIIKWQ
jgi:predicted HD phosphohydrolase